MDELLPIAHPDDAKAIEQNFKDALDGIRPYSIIHRIIQQDNGKERVVSAKGIVSFDQQGKPSKILGTVQDITERKLAEEELERHRHHLEVVVKERTHDLTLLNKELKKEIIIREKIETKLVTKEVNLIEAQRIAKLGTWQLDLVSGKALWSEDLFNMYGLDPKQPVPTPLEHRELFTEKGWEQLTTALTKVKDNGLPYTLELEHVRQGKENGWMLVNGEAIRDEKGLIVALSGYAQDVTERKRAELKLDRIGHYDILTNLPNRVLLAERLNQAILNCQHKNRSLAVAVLDLDGFKAVNDTYGNIVGDQLLVALAKRMQEAISDGDTLARIGGDEFIVVMVNVHNISDSECVLERLLKAAAEPTIIEDVLLQVSASIGVTLYPQDGVDSDQLIRHADQAMYLAKQAGKNRYHLFDTAKDNALKTQQESIGDVLSALVLHEFVLHYQPKVNMRSGEVIGVEALIRWQHPQLGMIQPLEFLPAIEGHAISLQLGEWVIDTALTQIRQWQSEGISLNVSVNISAYQLQQVNFTERLARLLAAYPEMTQHCLELEILETSALHDTRQASATMNACGELGVRFSIDDFGTGYSSLTYLKRLPAYLIKIDQSFVRDMLEDTDDLAIVKGVVGLTKVFGRDVIAEGVETIAHGSALLKLGCELAQGYGIAHPMPAADLPQWVANFKPDNTWKV